MPKIIQLGGVIRDISIFGNVLSNLAQKGTCAAGDLGKDFPDKQIDRLNKKYKISKGSGITLANYEIK